MVKISLGRVRRGKRLFPERNMCVCVISYLVLPSLLNGQVDPWFSEDFSSKSMFIINYFFLSIQFSGGREGKINII